ncbi:uncharacterized protein LOC144342248, partial [Saccoglossus kowalevskii]
LYEGDIMLTAEQRKRKEAGVPILSMKRGITNTIERYWHDNIVNYVFDDDDPLNELDRQFTRDALADLQKETCVTFVEGIAENYISITNGDGCWSYIGMIGGKQMLSLLSPEGNGGTCMWTGIIQHEFLHALGFYHEQSRPDRDCYVEIKWDNIIAGMESNFDIVEQQWIDLQDTPYDYGSLMHYGWNDFAIDRTQPTIVTTNPPGVAIGQIDGLSHWDIIEVNGIYDCNNYLYQGCFVDEGSLTQLTLLEDTGNPHLDGHYFTRTEKTRKCARAAEYEGYPYFALRNGGECYAASNPQQYSAQGTSEECLEGLGADQAIDVYLVWGPMCDVGSAYAIGGITQYCDVRDAIPGFPIINLCPAGFSCQRVLSESGSSVEIGVVVQRNLLEEIVIVAAIVISEEIVVLNTWTNAEIIEMLPGKDVTIDGIVAFPPVYPTPFLSITMAGYYLMITTGHGVKIIWDGWSTIQVYAVTAFYNNACGLCGLFNGISGDDFTTSSNTPAISINEFGNSWSVGPGCVPMGDAGRRDLTSTDPCTLNPNPQAQIICDQLFDRLSECDGVIDPAEHIAMCVMDMCDTLAVGDDTGGCPIAATYAGMCQDSGVAISDWRSDTPCAIECPANQVYKTCGSTCPPTCDIPFPVAECTQQCIEGCFCEEGLILDVGNVCIPQSECGCYAMDTLYR